MSVDPERLVRKVKVATEPPKQEKAAQWKIPIEHQPNPEELELTVQRRIWEGLNPRRILQVINEGVFGGKGEIEDVYLTTVDLNFSINYNTYDHNHFIGLQFPKGTDLSRTVGNIGLAVVAHSILVIGGYCPKGNRCVRVPSPWGKGYVDEVELVGNEFKKYLNPSEPNIQELLEGTLAEASKNSSYQPPSYEPPNYFG
ncbi:MAG: hypothetical protein V1858_04875 [Candidatus Gottesmanbacteria bacterium]